MTPNSSHAAFRQLAAMAVDFELAPDQRRELDGHLSSCVECRQFSSSLSSDRALLRDRRRDIPPRRLEDAVLALDGGARSMRPPFRFGLSWAAVAIALLSVALLASAAFVGARLLLRPPVTIIQPGPAEQHLGDLPLAGSISVRIDVPIGTATEGHDCHVVQLSDCATGIAFGAGSVWTTTTQGIVRIDPVTNRPIATIGLPDFPRAIAIGSGRVWVAVMGDSSLVEIDPATNAIAKRIPIGGFLTDVAADDAGIWVSTETKVVRVDPATATIADEVPLDSYVARLAPAGGRLVAALPNDGMIAVIDEASLRITYWRTGSPTWLAIDGSTAWSSGHDTVSSVSLDDGTQADDINVMNMPSIAFGGPAGRQELWVASGFQRGLERIDPRTRLVDGGIALPGDSEWWDATAAWGADSLWVRMYAPGQVIRITPIPAAP